ncbi:hypothetical protein PISMIDRAFT_127545 [Pisolithus microcarpus 441]|uniref:Unplaced genomic scaffold scaffold_1, whole genome shotgun sequence n=1 Tax=Pisolithus microcarpus 441 TaxID=765257 RepID=A0A0C9ZNP0_9AGAM|nr:hypothetical protein PISMIDRAFT_127545 [Pisolithus microcarpus 441]
MERIFRLIKLPRFGPFSNVRASLFSTSHPPTPTRLAFFCVSQFSCSSRVCGSDRDLRVHRVCLHLTDFRCSVQMPSLSNEMYHRAYPAIRSVSSSSSTNNNNSVSESTPRLAPLLPPATLDALSSKSSGLLLNQSPTDVAPQARTVKPATVCGLPLKYVSHARSPKRVLVDSHALLSRIYTPSPFILPSGCRPHW